MRTAMQFPLGKRIDRTEVAPVSGLSSSLFIKDKISGLKYLVDTGAEVSVLPPSRVSARCPSAIQLHAANATTIKTYGQRLLNVGIGLRRQFPWGFLVADIQQPILGADVLTNFSLQVDLSSKRLLDSSTNLSINGCSVFTTDPSCTAISLMPLSLPTDFSYLLNHYLQFGDGQLVSLFSSLGRLSKADKKLSFCVSWQRHCRFLRLRRLGSNTHSCIPGLAIRYVASLFWPFTILASFSLRSLQDQVDTPGHSYIRWTCDCKCVAHQSQLMMWRNLSVMNATASCSCGQDRTPTSNLAGICKQEEICGIRKTG